MKFYPLYLTMRTLTILLIFSLLLIGCRKEKVPKDLTGLWQIIRIDSMVSDLRIRPKYGTLIKTLPDTGSITLIADSLATLHIANDYITCGIVSFTWYVTNNTDMWIDTGGKLFLTFKTLRNIL